MSPGRDVRTPASDGPASEMNENFFTGKWLDSSTQDKSSDNKKANETPSSSPPVSSSPAPAKQKKQDGRIVDATVFANPNVHYHPVPVMPMEMMKATRADTVNQRHRALNDRQDKLKRLAYNNPFVPIGMAATTFCMTGIIIAMIRGNRMQSNFFMRGRIACQFFTFASLVAGAFVIGTGSGDKTIFDSWRAGAEKIKKGIVG